VLVSPADFELYSRSTGRPIPRNPQERMQMTPEVYNFVQNRGYQQSGPTFIQQGADFLSKAATVGGALVAANALAGGFNKKGVSQAAQAVENVAGAIKRAPFYPEEVEEVASGVGAIANEVADRAPFIAKTRTRTERAPFIPRTRTGRGDFIPKEGVTQVIGDALPSNPDGSVQIVDQSPIRNDVDNWLARNEHWIMDYDEGQPLEERSHEDLPKQGYYSRQSNRIADDLTQRAIGTDDFYERRQSSPPPSSPPPSSPPQSENPPQSGRAVPADYSIWDGEDERVGTGSNQTYNDYVSGVSPQSGQKALTGRKDVVDRVDDFVDEVTPATVVPADDPAVQRVEGNVSAQPKGAFGRALARVGDRARQDTGTLIKALDDEPFGALKEQAAARDLSIGIALRGLGVPGLPKGGLAPGTGFNEGATQEILGFTGNLPLVRQGLTEPAKRIAGYSPFRGAEVNLPNWLGGGFEIPGIPETGQIAGNILASNPDLAAFMNARGVTIAELAALGIGTGVGGAAKDLAKVGIKAGKAVAPFHNRVLVPAGRAAAGFHGNVLVPGGRQFHENVLVPGGRRLGTAVTGYHTNVLVPAGREFNRNVISPGLDNALDGIQRNLAALQTSADQQFNIDAKVRAISESVLPTTRETGVVIPGRQLNAHPDIGPLERDNAPSRLIQRAKDQVVLAAMENQPGSLTPDDDWIRTDIGTTGAYREPVNVRTWAGGKRPSVREKAEFRAGLRDRNSEFFQDDRAAKVDRRTTGINWETGKRGAGGGSAGYAGSGSGAIQYQSPDDAEPMNPLQILGRYVQGATEQLTPEEIAAFEAKEEAKRLGGRIANRDDV